MPVVILSADATAGRITRLLGQGAHVRQLVALIDDTLRDREDERDSIRS